MRPALILLPLILAAMAGCSKSDETSTKDEAAPQAGARMLRGVSTEYAGTLAPGTELEISPNGETDTIAALLAENPGKPLLVNLWATWCAPCLRELPGLDRLAAETGDALVVVAISQDMEGWRKVTPWLEANPLPNLTVRLESKMQYGFAAKATGLPVTILYGPDGKEKWRYAGDREWDSPEARKDIGVQDHGPGAIAPGPFPYPS